MVRGGAESRLIPDCEREHYRVGRFAPPETLWCGGTANPRFSIDVPLALSEIPARGQVMRFDLVVPVVFDEGAPVEVRFGNRVDQDDWELTLPALPRAGSSSAAAGEPGAAHP